MIKTNTNTNEEVTMTKSRIKNEINRLEKIAKAQGSRKPVSSFVIRIAKLTAQLN